MSGPAEAVIAASKKWAEEHGGVSKSIGMSIRANIDDEPRDDHGRWTTGGDGTDVYANPVVPRDASSKVTVDVELAKAIGTHKANGETVDDFLGHSNVYDPEASGAKAMVAHNIAEEMDSKYDTKLLGTNGGKPVTSLLTENDVWLHDPSGDYTGENVYNYIGTKADYMSSMWVGSNEKDFAQGVSDGSIKLGNDPTLLTDLREDAVSKLVTSWARSSNDHNVASMAMQVSAVKEFNLKGTTEFDDARDGNGLSYDFIDNEGIHHTFADQVQDEVAKNGDMYQAFLRAQYDNTQQFFKDNGITQVTAYRGFDFTGRTSESAEGPIEESPEFPKWADPERQDDIDDSTETWTADVSLRPLSAFAYNRDSAVLFSGPHGIAMPGTGAIISGVIPASRILSTALTGNGCLGEKELVVLGGTDTWTVE